jgi:hypothetical protein
MASALGCSLFDSMCLEIGRRNVAFEQAQQTRIGRRSNRRTPVRSGSFPSAHLSDAQLLPNSRDYAAPHKVMSGYFWLADGKFSSSALATLPVTWPVFENVLRFAVVPLSSAEPIASPMIPERCGLSPIASAFGGHLRVQVPPVDR